MPVLLLLFAGPTPPAPVTIPAVAFAPASVVDTERLAVWLGELVGCATDIERVGLIDRVPVPVPAGDRLGVRVPEAAADGPPGDGSAGLEVAVSDVVGEFTAEVELEAGTVLLMLDVALPVADCVSDENGISLATAVLVVVTVTDSTIG